MRKLPVDVSTLSFFCAGEPAEVIDFESRRPKTDENGVPLYQVALLAVADGVADVMAVKVPGAPKGLVTGAPVRVVGLSANPWENGDRHGIAFRANTVEPTRPERAAS
jgi:hypothetical protein